MLTLDGAAEQLSGAWSEGPVAKNGRFIAVANMKGGVGKTTTVVSLAEALAADELSARVLVVDLDPQASASFCLAGDEGLTEIIQEGRTLQDFLEMRLFEAARKQTLREFIRRRSSFTRHRNQPLDIALLPCGPQLRHFERDLVYRLTKQNYSMNGIEGQLWKLFKGYFTPLRSEYDYVIFDCPPGISPFTEVAIRSSDLVIVPTIPDQISNFGLDTFCQEIWHPNGSTLPVPGKPFVLATRVEAGVKQHQTMLRRFEAEAEQADAAFRLMHTRIPKSAALANALVAEAEQTYSRKYGEAAIQMLKKLVAEIKEVVHADGH